MIGAIYMTRELAIELLLAAGDVYLTSEGRQVLEAIAKGEMAYATK